MITGAMMPAVVNPAIVADPRHTRITAAISQPNTSALTAVAVDSGDVLVRGVGNSDTVPSDLEGPAARLSLELIRQGKLKALPGLAGESRSGDANGQWFRVLVAGGTYVTPLGNGQMFLTDTPVGGINPMPPTGGRSPLRADVIPEGGLMIFS